MNILWKQFQEQEEVKPSRDNEQVLRFRIIHNNHDKSSKILRFPRTTRIHGWECYFRILTSLTLIGKKSSVWADYVLDITDVRRNRYRSTWRKCYIVQHSSVYSREGWGGRGRGRGRRGGGGREGKALKLKLMDCSIAASEIIWKVMDLVIYHGLT